MRMSGKDFLKSHVLRWWRKVYSDWEDVTSSGRTFQVFGSATGKARLPTLASFLKKQINGDGDSGVGRNLYWGWLTSAGKGMGCPPPRPKIGFGALWAWKKTSGDYKFVIVVVDISHWHNHSWFQTRHLVFRGSLPPPPPCLRHGM